MVSVELLPENNTTIIDFGGDSSNLQATPLSDDQKSCKVCGIGPCTTFCSLCKIVYYCSVDCQRIDWIKGKHKSTCIGKKHRKPPVPKTKKKKTNSMPGRTMGPVLPPPKSISNERDAKRALQELYSIAEMESKSGSAMTGEDKRGVGTTQPKGPPTGSVKGNAVLQTTTKIPPKPPQKTNSSFPKIHQSEIIEPETGWSEIPEPENKDVFFVVEEMPQICRFQLTITKTNQRKLQEREIDATSSIDVSSEPVGRSGSRTLVMVREKGIGYLFAGEFPRPIRASDITWSISTNNSNNINKHNSDGDSDGDDENCLNTVIVLRLPYPYDPSNTSSLALGGSLEQSYGTSSTSEPRLDEINTVVCGACHLPLIVQKPMSTETSISRVFPLPQGHWDEIADYLICYDGQPVVDFSAGSECAEPSVALQDASLICFHREDVEAAVCALAVDGYGELTEESGIDQREASGLLDQNEELGSFFNTKTSSSFVLPTPLTDTENVPAGSVPAAEQEMDNRQTTQNTTSIADNTEPEISATSAVIRGDRTWQDAVDGDSVSLCCARCCSPLGFCSLGSPETWRFWKHRLSIPVQGEQTSRGSNESKTETENEIDKLLLLRQPRTSFPRALPVSTKPLASCSSFLARELVRYAESKAIFTFVVRCEGTGKGRSGIANECLLLRLLSWESAMATSFAERKSNSNSKSKTNERESRGRALQFRRVAKIVFEVTSDPTVTRKSNANRHGDKSNGNDDGETPTQWFWGGVDLCCPPPSQATSTSPSPGGVSTTRLQLPSDEYNAVLEDLVSGKALFEPEIAKATILLKMGGLSEGLGLTAVALQ